MPPSNPGDTTNYPGWVKITEFWFVSTPALGLGQGKLCSMMGDSRSDHDVQTAIITGPDQKPKDVVVVIRGNKEEDRYRDVREFILEVPGDDYTGEREERYPFEERLDLESDVVINAWADEEEEEEEEGFDNIGIFQYGRIYEYDGIGGMDGDPQNSEERQLELDKWHWRWWAYNVAITSGYPTEYVIRDGDNPTHPDDLQEGEEDDPEDLAVKIDVSRVVDGVSYFAPGYHVHLGVGSINPHNEDDIRRVTLFEDYSSFRFRSDNLSGRDWQAFVEQQIEDGNPLGFGFETEEIETEEGTEDYEYVTGSLFSLSWVLGTWFKDNSDDLVPSTPASEVPDYIEGSIQSSKELYGELSSTFEPVPIMLPVVKLEYEEDELDPDTPEAPNIYNIPSTAAVVMRRQNPTPPESED
jgi:hypothetical protein